MNVVRFERILATEDPETIRRFLEALPQKDLDQITMVLEEIIARRDQAIGEVKPYVP
ncbi:MAG: hypothetical protein NXH95_13540 [Pseudomonadaceae bacterium]|nr:hypothetical protein [Pseudomonadaceae bacterium]